MKTSDNCAPKQPCLRLSGTPRAHFLTVAEAVTFAATNANYAGDIPRECPRCFRVHLYRPEWLATRRVRIIRDGQIVSSKIFANQDDAIEYLRQALRPGEEFIISPVPTNEVN